MKIIKPLDLSFSYRTFAWDGQHHLAASVFLAFPLGQTTGCEPMLEQDMWNALAEQLEQNQILDLGMPKPRGEALIFGCYHAPQGQAVQAGDVEFRLGPLYKTLRVIGNRYWRSVLGPTEPEPFKTMPLSYTHAFGGKNYPKNPLGKGLDEIDVFGEKRLPLPNIEDPRHLLTSPGQRPDPAGFGPLAPDWEPRLKRMGTYDDKWLRERAPGYAADLDWTHFNAAPRDQWLEDFFTGDEAYALAHMHPEKSLIEGELPGYRVRCFAEHGRDFSEIDMKAETVFFFPGAEMGIVLYRGSRIVADDEASDIAHIVLAYEHLQQTPRSEQHYRQALNNRLGDNSLKYLMRSDDLIADGILCGFKRMLGDDSGDPSFMAQNMEAKAEDLRQEVQQQIEQQKQALAEQLQAWDIDPTPYLAQFDTAAQTKTDPDLEQLLQLMEQIMPMDRSDPKQPKLDIEKLDLGRLDEIGTALEEIAQKKKQAIRGQLQQSLDELPELEEVAPLREKMRAALDNMDRLPPLPRPRFDQLPTQLQQQQQALEQQLARIRELGIPEEQWPSTNFGIEFDELRQQLAEAQQQIKGTYRLGAHFMADGAPPHDVPLDIVLHRFNKALEKGQTLAGGDYACLDLSGRDLSGIDLSGAYLEQVDFTNTKLAGANLEEAIIVRAKLAGADLRGTRLSRANLGASDLSQADLSGADLKEAILSRATLKGSKLIDCDLTSAEFLQAQLSGADLSGSRLPQAVFVETAMHNINCAGADLSEASFIQLDMQQSDFTQARLDGATWIECQLDNCRFHQAELNNARFVGACSLKQADFSQTRLNRANLRDSDCTEADFTQAQLDMADFGKACLRKARFTLASAKQAQFVGADLEQAGMSNVNLMEGSLMKARLLNTDLSHSNCYAVEFMNATVGGTRFTGTNLDRSKLENWHP